MKRDIIIKVILGAVILACLVMYLIPTKPTKDELKFKEEYEKNMLKNHLTTLQNLAGAEAKLTIQDQTTVVHDDNAEYVTRLKEIFGDKVEIV